MISKIEIIIDGKKIKLSLDQAEELYGELDKMFGKDVEYRYYYPKPAMPYYPYWTYSTCNDSLGNTTTAIYPNSSITAVSSDTAQIHVKSQ